MPSIKYYKLETYTNSGFQISSYHDFEVTQIKNQVRCAASEAWSLCGIRLHPLLPQASTQNSRRLTGMPEAQTDIASTYWAFFLASGTLAAQMWRGKGEETTLTEIESPADCKKKSSPTLKDSCKTLQKPFKGCWRKTGIWKGLQTNGTFSARNQQHEYGP